MPSRSLSLSVLAGSDLLKLLSTVLESTLPVLNRGISRIATYVNRRESDPRLEVEASEAPSVCHVDNQRSLRLSQL